MYRWGRYPFALPAHCQSFDQWPQACPGGSRLAAGEQDTDQWARPWPNRPAHRERILNDLSGRHRIAWTARSRPATITVDTEEPLDLHERPI